MRDVVEGDQVEMRRSEAADSETDRLQAALAAERRTAETRRRELAHCEQERERLALEVEVRVAESTSLRETFWTEREKIDRQREELDSRRKKLESRREALEARRQQVDRQREQLEARRKQLETRGKRFNHQQEMRPALLRAANANRKQLGSMSAEIQALREQTATYLGALPKRRLRTMWRLSGWLMRLRVRSVREYFALRRSGRFDATYYMMRYPEVVAARENPILDFVERGAARGRNPSADFDTTEYLAKHRELIDSGENPFLHYLRVERGAAERSSGAERGR